MAQGEPFDNNISEDEIQLDDFNELVIFEMWPQYVINVTIIDENIQRTLPEIRIPRRFTVFHPGFYIDLVRRSLNELTRYSLTAGPGHNPLLSMLAWNADYWSITFNASGEFLEIAFYPVYFYGPSAERVETSTSESSLDDEQPGPSHQVNNRSEIRTGGSSMNRSSTDDEQPGPSHRVNNRSEIRSEASRTPADQSSGSQIEIREGVKRKRKTSGRSKSKERKKNRSDHHSDSDSSSDSLSAVFFPPSLGETSRDDDQPGPSHRDNSEARASADQSSRDESRRGGKRRRKTSEHPDTQSKRRRSDH
ncbi:hypothetical protein DPX16_11424 [Anabarilius grahami]|uniref:Uncharacterized protein n=1 Tax=Anabarilius grahami TaxID=495550 RepID=A0A3N0Y4D6_ANAGA|nr:hypothetical protein DPX16_11424 [Anabarilius grahami]